MPQNISIRSVTLEQLDLGYCSELTNITLDTPQLKTFFYNSSDLQLSSVTSIHCICNACVKLTPDDKFDTQSLVRINGLLSRSKCWKVLSVDLSHAFEVKIEIDMDELSKSHAAPPYEIEELELSLSCSISKKSSLITLLDGLFWSCHPTLLSLSITIPFDERNSIVEFLQEKLQEKVECLKHPLKWIGTESTNYLPISSSRAIDLQLRLLW